MTNTTDYNAGDTYQLTLDTTRLVAGVPTHLDAVTVQVSITDPAGAVTVFTLAGGGVVRTGIGAYVYQGVAAIPGTWLYVWTADGTATDGPWTVVEEDQFTAKPTGERLLSLPELKLALRYPASDVGADDAELRDMIDSATDMIESFCGPMLPRAVTETITSTRGRVTTLRNWPVLSLTTLDGVSPVPVDQTTATTAGTNGWVTVLDTTIGTYTSTVGGVLVYQVGRKPTPPVVRQAARELLRGWWQGGRQRSGSVPGVYLTPDAYDARSIANGSHYGMPYAVLDKLRPYRRFKEGN